MKSGKVTKPTSTRQLGMLKLVLILASVTASLLGAQMIASADRASSMPAQVVVQTGTGARRVELGSVPTVISPAVFPPVARSQSSR